MASTYLLQCLVVAVGVDHFLAPSRAVTGQEILVAGEALGCEVSLEFCAPARLCAHPLQQYSPAPAHHPVLTVILQRYLPLSLAASLRVPASATWSSRSSLSNPSFNKCPRPRTPLCTQCNRRCEGRQSSVGCRAHRARLCALGPASYFRLGCNYCSSSA